MYRMFVCVPERISISLVPPVASVLVHTRGHRLRSSFKPIDQLVTRDVCAYGTRPVWRLVCHEIKQLMDRNRRDQLVLRLLLSASWR